MIRMHRIFMHKVLGKLTSISLALLLTSAILTGCIDRPVETTTKENAPPGNVEDIQEIFDMQLTSSAFENNGEIPNQYAYKMGSQCNGENYSPALTWSQPPDGTRSLLLTVVDPDGGNWVHWVLFNIPPETTSLEEVIGGSTAGRAGRNDFGKPGYGGPCPPSGTHHYIFTLYALDIVLDLKEGASLNNVLKSSEGHVLTSTSLTGLKTR
jgi:Raf kinase inhibitor-like YbhB/YbcL family protein